LHNGSRSALATVVHGPSGAAAAEVTLVGRSEDVVPREKELSKLLLKHVSTWQKRSGAR
jgi:hypothetical protein